MDFKDGDRDALVLATARALSRWDNEGGARAGLPAPRRVGVRPAKPVAAFERLYVRASLSVAGSGAVPRVAPGRRRQPKP